MEGRNSALWSFALLLGWLLSFPLHGPLLGPVAALHGGDPAALALIFTLFHGVGLAVSGLTLPTRYWRAAMQWGALACFLLSGLLYFAPGNLQPAVMGGLALAAALFIVGWSRLYVTAVRRDRVRFMAVLTLVANLFLYGAGLLVGRLPLGVLFLAFNLPLLASARLAFRPVEVEDGPATAGDGRFPGTLLALVAVLILGLYVNGGLLYNLVYPAFQAFQPLDAYYQELPYLATLVLLWRFGKDTAHRLMAYLGASLLGLGFVAFGLLGTTLPGYLLTVTLILSAFALLDIFVWTLLAQLSEFHGRGLAIFGVGAAVNIWALYVGGILSERLGQLGPGYPVTTGLLASGTVFLTLVILPVIHDQAFLRLAGRLRQELAPAREEDLPHNVVRCFPGASELTEREWEIVGLMVGGATNEEIARRLVISYNTVKVHVRNINRKLAIANRNELLSALLRTGAGTEAAAAKG